MGHHKKKKPKQARAGKRKRCWKLGFCVWDYCKGGNGRLCKTSDAKRVDSAESSLQDYMK